MYEISKTFMEDGNNMRLASDSHQKFLYSNWEQDSPEGNVTAVQEQWSSLVSSGDEKWWTFQQNNQQTTFAKILQQQNFHNATIALERNFFTHTRDVSCNECVLRINEVEVQVCWNISYITSYSL
jgi:hypothetical protein